MPALVSLPFSPSSADIGEAEQGTRWRPNDFLRIVAAIGAPNRRKAVREIAHLVERNGSVLTDRIERLITEQSR
jgi:hypothetical protein